MNRDVNTAKEGNMTLSEVNRLAVYNSEVTRGIVHTEETRREMAELQRRFDAGEYRIPPPPTLWQRLFW